MNGLMSLLMKDGLKVADLERIHAAARDPRPLVVEAIRAMRHLDSPVAWRAVWLLKRAAGAGRLSADDVSQIARQADELPHWAARLNLCQLFAATGCPEPAREALFPYLVECFSNARPMIRAWALSVLVQFDGDPRFEKMVAACLREAEADPAGSIQARLRRLEKQSRGRRSVVG